MEFIAELFLSSVADHRDMEFDWPIELHDGGKLVTLRDAAEYIRQLPADLKESELWQVAVKDLSRAVEAPAWRYLARLAMQKALRLAKSSAGSGTSQ